MRKLITAGVDEVGRGCLAGPVVSAAVVLKKSINLKLLKDSKKITFEKREFLSRNWYGIGRRNLKFKYFTSIIAFNEKSN